MPDRDHHRPTVPQTLRQAYADAFSIGVAIPASGLSAAEQELLVQHFNTVTPENCMKPRPMHPAENRYEFAAADALVQMAQASGLTVNGHTLVWHAQCPDWFFASASLPGGRRRVLRRLRDHIATVVGRYAGKVQSWDVVNEAIGDGDDDLRKTKWLTSLGEGYLAEAFHAARKADPQAQLYYNDYSIEWPQKRAKTLRLIRDLKRRGAPIDGIGIQGHWELDKIPYAAIEEAIIAFHREGLAVAITELDIDVVPRQVGGADVSARQADQVDPFVNGLPPDVQKRLADQYGRLFALFYKHRDKIRRVTFWGLHDGRSWLNTWPCSRTNHPLLWDRSLQPKPAFRAVLTLPQQATSPGCPVP